MGLIAKVLSFTRAERNEANVSDVKVDPGGGATETLEHFAPAGEDAHPMPGDFAGVVPVQGTGRNIAVGYVDPSNEQKSELGEKRIYARGADGALIVEIWLKNDGEATMVNANGQVTLKPDGAVLLGEANQAQVLGDAMVAFNGEVLDQVIALCTASTTMGSVLGADIAAALTLLKGKMDGNSDAGQIRSEKHKTGFN